MPAAPAELTTLLSDRLFETIALIEADDLSAQERALIPPWWLEAVRMPGRDGLAHALAAWPAALRNALPAVTQTLIDHGLGVFLGRSPSENKVLLAYAAAPPSGDPSAAGTAFHQLRSCAIQR